MIGAVLPTSAFASYVHVFTVQTQRNVDNEQLAPLTGTNYEFDFKGEFFDKRLYAAVSGGKTWGPELARSPLNGASRERIPNVHSKNADGTRLSPDTPQHVAKLNTTYKIGDLTVGDSGTCQSRIYRAMPIPTGAFRSNGQPVTPPATFPRRAASCST